MEEEKVEKKSNLDEILKDSTLLNPDLTFCEKTTYLDFLLSNATTEEEKEDIKNTINEFLEISKDEEEENNNDDSESDEDVEIELVSGENDDEKNEN